MSIAKIFEMKFFLFFFFLFYILMCQLKIQSGINHVVEMQSFESYKMLGSRKKENKPILKTTFHLTT